MGNSSVKLTRAEGPNNLHLHLERGADSNLTQKMDNSLLFLNGILILSACLPITQWPVSMVTVTEMMLRPSPSNWLVRLPYIESQVSLAVKQDSLLIQNSLASRGNFLAMPVWHSRVDWRGFRRKCDSSSTLQFPGISQSHGTQIRVTLNRLERRLRQWRYSLTLLELKTPCNRAQSICDLFESNSDLLIKYCHILCIATVIFCDNISRYYDIWNSSVNPPLSFRQQYEIHVYCTKIWKIFLQRLRLSRFLLKTLESK